MSFSIIPNQINRKYLTPEELKIYFNLRKKLAIKYINNIPVDIYYACILSDDNVYFYYFGEKNSEVISIGSGGYIPDFHTNNEIIYEFFQKSVDKYTELFNHTAKHIINTMHDEIRAEFPGINEEDRYRYSFSVPKISLKNLYCQMLNHIETEHYFDLRGEEVSLENDQKILKFSCTYEYFCSIFYSCYRDGDGTDGSNSNEDNIKFTYFIEYDGNVFIVGSGGYIPTFHKDDSRIHEFFIDSNSLDKTSLEICNEEHRSYFNHKLLC